MNKSDTYSTPRDVFDYLDYEFGFSTDVCAEHKTAKCPTYWTIKDDALSMDWCKEADLSFGRWLWCNPPYSNIKPWIEKAKKAQLDGVGTVMLVMADPSVKWFSSALETVSEVRWIINGRLSFEMDGQPVKGNNKGSCILVFDPFRVGTCFTSYVSRSDLCVKSKSD